MEGLIARLENSGTGRFPAAVEKNEDDIPVGTPDIKTGGGVNNYVPPSINVSGALTRLLATNKEA
jgi:hypothetical protein